MERVGVRELRQNLSVYLRRVQEGEALEVTERGRPVALLGPLEDPLASLEARGLQIRRGRGSVADVPSPVPALGSVADDGRSDRL
jgi:prevent-host-death family protein